MDEKVDECQGAGAGHRKMFLADGSKLRARLQGKTFLVPSFITVTALFCGFLAIIRALHGDFEYATKCIALAIVLDGLDGRVARRLNATSEFGREFDSLSDLVAFGVAPAVLVYMWAFNGTVDDFGLVAGFVFVSCGATRLARFNIMSTSSEAKSSFCGLPIPGAAAAIASVVYCFPARLEQLMPVAIVLAYIILLAILMVSTISFFSIKKLKITQGNPRLNLLLLSALVALIWKFSSIVILVGSTGYALSGLVGYLWRTVHKKHLPELKQQSGI